MLSNVLSPTLLEFGSTIYLRAQRMLSAVFGALTFLGGQTALSLPLHRLFDICCREEEWKYLHLARGSSRMPSCQCAVSDLHRTSVPASCLAGCLTRTIWQACVVAQSFLQAIKSSPLPLIRAHKKKFLETSLCLTRPVVTYLKAEPIYIRTYATGLFFSLCSFLS
jgi:hypothetical protein